MWDSWGNWVQKLLGALSAYFALMCFLLAFASFNVLVIEDEPSIGVFWALGLFLFFAVFAFWLGSIAKEKLLPNWRPRQKASETVQETIIRIALAGNGRTTIDDVVLQTELSEEEVKSEIENLCRYGVAVKTTNTAGLIQYIFSDLSA